MKIKKIKFQIYRLTRFEYFLTLLKCRINYWKFSSGVREAHTMGPQL